jgi:hypothetical protein
MGIAPTGKTIQVSGLEVLLIVDGRIVEEWTNWDQLGLQQQLGAVSLRAEGLVAFVTGPPNQMKEAYP